MPQGQENAVHHIQCHFSCPLWTLQKKYVILSINYFFKEGEMGR